ncbi:hypothetical protein SPRG_03111 [Saprolegnia parasitica CBS 223.65]|uniref:F-box domain-containing protein n=1 Tax=Saprolegnia parasitica (strain CBS 223.65) TaxID=695850 RepID=A0A067CRL8_SAPPC|nr:hypothetical protein SPRG_03111 [Saprolegnia parasitica CBS 223.65]KDO31895.1 hypothetical protein SPRG_03111 [Saprolegnia parasitica CBS 223.65]|eukprot:XP_012197094.1 hypothetical protein SPRG_03111 [Saprolegnia parasitica CBS 223.65]
MDNGSIRQATVSPTVLQLDHVLTAIVQCMAATKDIKAFLAALSALVRGSTHLAALHDLLQAPQRHVWPSMLEPLDALWPLLNLSEISPAAISLARDAMPVFSWVSVGPIINAWPHDLDAVEWLRLWSTKITHYKHNISDIVQGDPRLYDVLRQCTNPTDVDVYWSADADAILEVVTTPAHRVRSLQVQHTTAAASVVLDRWLASGHADHLDFTYYSDDDGGAVDAALVPMLLKTTVLSSLVLRLDENELFARLVVAAPLFIPLEELTIKRDWLGGTLSPVTLPSTLRRIMWRGMSCFPAALQALATSVSHLDELTLIGCPLFPAAIKFLVGALPDWIHRGAKKITFVDCGIDDTAVIALAAALPRTTSRLGTILTIKDIAGLSVHSYVALGKALASCHGVSMQLPLLQTFQTEAESRSIQYRFDADCIVLESPLHSSWV